MAVSQRNIIYYYCCCCCCHHEYHYIVSFSLYKFSMVIKVQAQPIKGFSGQPLKLAHAEFLLVLCSSSCQTKRQTRDSSQKQLQ